MSAELSASAGGATSETLHDAQALTVPTTAMCAAATVGRWRNWSDSPAVDPGGAHRRPCVVRMLALRRWLSSGTRPDVLLGDGAAMIGFPGGVRTSFGSRFSLVTAAYRRATDGR